MFGRKCLLWLAVTIGVLSTATAVAQGAARERPCNGSVDLCGKSLDQVVLPGTHNSMSSEEYGWLLPNQHHSIPTQLEMGIRALLIDTHYGKETPGAGSGVANWNAEVDGDPAGIAGTYLCHEFCSLGASELTAELGKVADFLSSHPREAVVFVVQNAIAPADFASAVTASGLSDYLYFGSTDQYPTLGQMIAGNQRVVMLSEGNTDPVPWFHNAYSGPMQETPYDFRKNEAGEVMTTRQAMDLLTDPATLNSTCRPFRGGSTGNLFLMNHWVNGKLDNSNGVIPDPAVAQVLNQPEVLVNRARACEARRGKLPTIIAVDQFGDGDLLAAARELNGITAKPFFEVKRPKSAVARAGKKATFRLTTSNWGEASGAKVCVRVPRRLAIRPKCRKFKVARANPARKTVTIVVKTRRKAKGSGFVRFTVSGGGDRVQVKTKLRVKPVKKKARRGKRR